MDEMWVTSRVESSPRLKLGEETGTSDLQPQEPNFAKIKKEPGSRFFPQSLQMTHLNFLAVLLEKIQDKPFPLLSGIHQY